MCKSPNPERPSQVSTARGPSHDRVSRQAQHSGCRAVQQMLLCIHLLHRFPSPRDHGSHTHSEASAVVVQQNSKSSRSQYCTWLCMQLQSGTVSHAASASSSGACATRQHSTAHIAWQLGGAGHSAFASTRAPVLMRVLARSSSCSGNTLVQTSRAITTGPRPRGVCLPQPTHIATPLFQRGPLGAQTPHVHMDTHCTSHAITCTGNIHPPPSS